MMETERFLSRWAGWCLIAAGALFIVIGILTPMLVMDDPRRSAVFPWRQATAALIALLMMFGAIGVYLRHPARDRVPLRVTFVAACAGSALLLGHEWQELFLARDVAAQFPGAIEKLDEPPGLSPFTQGALISITMFMLGWLALALATMIGGGFSRWGGGLFIVGLFAMPILSAALPMPLGPWIGAPIIAAGLVRLGLDVARTHRPGQPPRRT